jgi:hypothetical protein
MIYILAFSSWHCSIQELHRQKEFHRGLLEVLFVLDGRGPQHRPLNECGTPSRRGRSCRIQAILHHRPTPNQKTHPNHPGSRRFPIRPPECHALPHPAGHLSLRLCHRVPSLSRPSHICARCVASSVAIDDNVCRYGDRSSQNKDPTTSWSRLDIALGGLCKDGDGMQLCVDFHGLEGSCS